MASHSGPPSPHFDIICLRERSGGGEETVAWQVVPNVSLPSPTPISQIHSNVGLNWWDRQANPTRAGTHPFRLAWPLHPPRFLSDLATIPHPSPVWFHSNSSQSPSSFIPPPPTTVPLLLTFPHFLCSGLGPLWDVDQQNDFISTKHPKRADPCVSFASFR